MKKIEFQATHEGQLSNIKLTNHRSGGDAWMIYINDYYQGDLQYKNGLWGAALNKMSKLTPENVTALGKRVDDYTA